jgi:hypothetical protein
MDDSNIAGQLDLADVMKHLARYRPVFHSEADFQFAFAQTVTALSSDVRCRLEVPQQAIEAEATAQRGEHLDLACRGPSGQTLIEFKYATRGWSGTDPDGEEFRLRHHAAYDLTRRYYLHDIRRLERFTVGRDDTNGLAILLTNEPSLWSPAVPGKRTRYDNFRIHHGHKLAGHLVWGHGDAPRYDTHLEGSYALTWHEYSTIKGSSPTAFRWLAVEVSRTSR